MSYLERKKTLLLCHRAFYGCYSIQKKLKLIHQQIGDEITLKNFYYTNTQIFPGKPLRYHVVRAGISITDADFNIVRNSSYPYSLLHFVTEGAGTLLHNGNKYNLKAGHLFVLGPGEAHHYASSGRSGMTLNWIEFIGGDSDRFIRSILSAASPVIDESCSKHVNKYILKIFHQLQKKSEHYIDNISKLLYSILLCLDRKNPEKMSLQVFQGISSEMQAVQQYISSHMSDELSIEILASIVNFSPSHFARLFHKTFGITPARYILKNRIMKAKEALSFENVTVEDISALLGFCNTSHFIRIFKKEEGLTPSEFRRQALQFFNNPR